MSLRRYSTALLLFLDCTLCGAQSLPRVDLSYSALSTDTFSTGTFRLADGSDTLTLTMQVRRRGATSLAFDKPSYAVKLFDSNGDKLDTALLGMRSDNYWVLDAMAVDRARMRNRVAMDLWLEFSRKPWYYSLEPEMLNGYRGQMVQVYVNNSALGIYCLMERVDRKQLKLKKYSEKKGVQGLLYDSYANQYAIEYRYWCMPTPVDTLSTWSGWEQKYPDSEDGEPICWSRLYNHIYSCTHTYTADHADTVRQHLDMPVYIDYLLFCHLLSARDNVSKNIYLSFYNARDHYALYTPWDLDHSWGRQYNGQLEPSNTELDFSRNYLYYYMYSYGHLMDTLKTRYAELRGHYFTAEHIDSLFTSYFVLYEQTGMDTVEQGIWSGHNGIELNIKSEQPYIRQWVVERLAYLDSLYDYTPSAHPTPTTPTMLTPATASVEPNSVRKVWMNNRLYILRGRDSYDLLGRHSK